MWKTLLKRKRNNSSSSSKPQQKSPQQTLASEITNPSAGAAVCVLLAVKERAHSVPDVMWACAYCLVSWNVTQK